MPTPRKIDPMDAAQDAFDRGDYVEGFHLYEAAAILPPPTPAALSAEARETWGREMIELPAPLRPYEVD
jgi:hypothetical protein